MATGVELASAWVRIIPTMEGLQGKLSEALGPVEDESDKTGKKAGQRFSTGFKTGMTLLAGAVVGVVGKALLDSVNAASDLNEAGTAVGAVFGDSFGKINDWAKKANTNIGQSQIEALNAAKSFGVFGQAAGLTNEENAKFSTGLAELASDFASFHNVSPQEAIEAIGAGLRGEAEPLRKFGILMDDASLKAKAMEMGIYDGNGTLDAQAKILAANALIFDQAGAAQGDFARTSDGMANQQRILDASFQNLQATIGTALMPVMQGLLSVAQPITQWMTENPALVQILAITLGILAVAILAVVAAMWLMALNPVGIAIGLIVVAVGLLIAAIVALVMNWDTVVAWITSVWQGFVSWIVSVTDGFVSWWNSIWAAVGAWISSVWQGFVSWLQNIWTGFTSWIMGIVDGFFGWWNGIWAAVGNAIQVIWRVFLAFIQVLFGDQIRWIMATADAFFGWWNGIWNAVGNAIRTIWSAFVAAVSSVWSGFISWIQGIINGFFGWWNGIWATVGAALSAGFNAARSAATSILSGIISWLQGAVNGFFGWWNGIWGTVGDAVRNAFNGVAGFIGGIWDSIVSRIRGAVNGIIGTVNSMISGLNGLLGAVGKLAGVNLSIPKIPGLATGGTVTGSGTVLVGEKGPELLNLPKGASVDPDIENAGGRTVIFKNYAPLGQSPAQALTQFANRAEVLL